jgi:hypothetical protein
MKRFLLSFLLFLSLGFFAMAQENPCPTIVSGITLVDQGPDGATGKCKAFVRFTATGDVQAPKGVLVEVLDSEGKVIFSECKIIPAGSPATVYETSTFSAACGTTTKIRITRFTSSNGECQGGKCDNVIETPDNSPLPVKFKSFAASRSKEKVAIKWETATETNNKGFNVQRKTNGDWENIAFVFSAAQGGNSNTDLAYSFSDVNNTKSLSQYRIQQIDIDSRTSYSDIRSVRGEGYASQLLIYPNPSNDGKINVVFDDQLAKNVVVRDMSGRMIKQFKNVINNLAIENLMSGMYSIQVTDVSTSAIVVEKVIVKKR